MSRVDEAGWSPVGTDGTYRYSATVLFVFWPEAERRKLVAKWPDLAAEIGATWDEHRRRTEWHCVVAEREGYAVNQTAGNVSAFEAFLEGKGVTDPTSRDLIEYPDLRSQPRMISWPPRRTAACWCGSGRKYKQCCRPYGLGTLGGEQV